MKLFHRTKSRVQLFWIRRSLLGKISLCCLCVILANLLFFGCLVGFMILMTTINSNQRYELLYPADEVATVKIIHFYEPVYLHFSQEDHISEQLELRTVSASPLEDSLSTTCINELPLLSANQWWNDPHPIIVGGTLLITYANGSQEWICASGTFYYDTASGNYRLTNYYFDNEEFTAFLQEYGYQLP